MSKIEKFEYWLDTAEYDRGGIRMVVDYEKMNSTVMEYVKAVAAVFPVRRAVLYGSYAKGTANENSDVDVCFFIDDELRGGRRHDVLTRLLGITGKYSSLDTIYIEPNVFSIYDLQTDNPFVKEILHTGRDLPIA
jgi:predicted nucleotidyltransferase